MESKSLCNPPNKCWNAHPQHSSLQIFCNIQKSDAIPSEHRTSLAKIGSKQNTFRSPHQSCQNRYLMHMLRYSFKMHSGRGYLPKIIKVSIFVTESRVLVMPSCHHQEWPAHEHVVQDVACIIVSTPSSRGATHCSITNLELE
ncbi:uncharacterized protein LOC131329997 isoform X7 [Rhododendron vialii]|uniref:uncharacterized protein LOC131329997 isoform X7 n=1 Tax=Rhododendron vialii TaxID=182163 RepID=UPI00265FD14A|nr:uncharacterized protein LOC131329997 isoform X7 [Rhododendron vialii]XP_058219427.1 uncharacterized protein LOC131329997 isoform X7 [Rhododendron vialii]XP_058219428.1 uncharacterized protein LOC131329997 isoform X7 [Rhododendron vialii]XP_058219429.1 uncharacterized protein LOC131329997 isoform X7 [Rhododendron vialii]XP_058219430.1 uncharacterized protein LOC131329997 isoform X7 [Rhododendron vialii]XP_058219431.1 uncharacterized protein LOC131329997 isoform X7 [Rhododendron vialii]XP_05